MPGTSTSAGADLSVIIVTRNTCALTGAAVRSVLDSKDRLSKEIIVVDNGSTDDTPSALPREFPAVRYVRSERNLGFARANNLGAQQAAGEFLLLLNSDARLQTDTLAVALEWMRGHPECGVCGAQLLNPDGSRQNSIANFPTLATELLNKSLLRRIWPRRFPGKEHTYAEPVPVESVIGAFFLARRELWKRLGGFDERFFFFLEETDFCARAMQEGAQVMHLPQLRVWHGQGQTAGQMQPAARIEYWRSRYAYFQKHASVAARWALSTGLWVRLCADGAVSALLTLITLGQSGRWKQKFAIQRALLLWHCRGCPEEVGLPR
jgi:GT2 family glycosyltransferase